MWGGTFYVASPTRLGASLIATFVAAGLFASVGTAIAQDGYGYSYRSEYQSQQRYKRHAVRHSRPSAATRGAGKLSKKDATKTSVPQGAVFAVVSLADQHVTVYDSSGQIARSRISTGMPGHPTPIGLFSIIGERALAPLVTSTVAHRCR